jgi:hypothetical protein
LNASRYHSPSTALAAGKDDGRYFAAWVHIPVSGLFRSRGIARLYCNLWSNLGMTFICQSGLFPFRLRHSSGPLLIAANSGFQRDHSSYNTGYSEESPQFYMTRPLIGRCGSLGNLEWPHECTNQTLEKACNAPYQRIMAAEKDQTIAI